MSWFARYQQRRQRRAAHRALRLVNQQLLERAEDVLTLDSALVLRMLWLVRGR